MEMLQQIVEGLSKALQAPVLVSVAVGLEFAFRMVKTEKPLSIAYLIADSFKKVGEICSKIAQLLDKVLPQRIK